MIEGCIIFALLFSTICAILCFVKFGDSYVTGNPDVDMFMLGILNLLTSVLVTVILANAL